VPTLSLATVYRTVKQLVEEGLLETVELPGEVARYEPAGSAHHHHFQCRQCERLFDIPGCSDQLAATLPRGFMMEDHEVTLYGRCADCQRPSRGTAASRRAR
jgi:Fur family ferric uptake transcriptional regulator